MTLDELIEGIGVTVNSSGGGCGNKKLMVLTPDAANRLSINGSTYLNA